MQIHELPAESSLNANDYVALDNGTTNRKGKLKVLIESITSAIASRVSTLESNVMSLGVGTEITSGSLNDYTTYGNYFVSSANAPRITNSPVDEGAYTLYVKFNGGAREQILMSASANSFYRRRYASGSWQYWVQYVASPHFKTKTYTYAYSDMAAGSTVPVTATNLGVATPSGYTPIGFVTCHSGLRYVDVIWQDAAATEGTNMIVLYNHSTSARSGTATVTVLYAKTDLMS